MTLTLDGLSSGQPFSTASDGHGGIEVMESSSSNLNHYLDTTTAPVAHHDLFGI